MGRDREKGGRLMRAEELLEAIRSFFREHGMAETTFGRRAVNDGKFVGRVRDGARISPGTLKKVEAFMATLNCPAMSLSLRVHRCWPSVSYLMR